MILAPIFVVVGLEAGAAHGIADVSRQAAQIEKTDPARAAALYQLIARQDGWLAVLDHSDLSAAPGLAQEALLQEATQLSQQGNFEKALVAAGQVTQPSLHAQATQLKQSLALAGATALLRKGDYARALSMLSVPGVSGDQANSVRAQASVGVAKQLVAQDQAIDALPLLSPLAATNADASAEYEVALWSAANSSIKALDFASANSDLNTLISQFPSSVHAASARRLLTAPQSVVGTLADHAGNPVTAKVRLSSRFSNLSDGSYQTFGPFYYGNSDANGDFSISSVPVGGPYILEEFRNGGWTTLIDPSTGRPGDPAQVTPLAPADLAFIVLP